MRKSPLSNFGSVCVAALEYRDPEGPLKALAEPDHETLTDSSVAMLVGITESEVEERVAHACAEVRSQAERESREELERDRAKMLCRFEKSLKEFSAERAAFFRGVETELVQLALAIARKILQREAELDPNLLGGLVRIALDHMQHEGSVKLRVPLCDVQLWHRMNESKDWTVECDEALSAGDCIVETEVGSAHFGLETQIKSVEESLMQLVARRPERI